MTTIKLKVSDKVVDRFLWLLSHFHSDEVQILEDDSFESDKKYAHRQYQKLKSGKSKLIGLDEASQKLDEVISKYES